MGLCCQKEHVPLIVVAGLDLSGKSTLIDILHTKEGHQEPATPPPEIGGLAKKDRTFEW